MRPSRNATPSSLILWGLLFVPSALGLLALKAPTLADAHLWDALGCYVAQARFIAQHGLDFSRYAELGFVRPPLFTGTLALVMLGISASRQALHVATVLFCAAILPSLYLLVRRLGGTRRAALLGVALCTATPPFFAQAGLVHSDLPATAFTTLAWLLVLQGRRRSFALVATLGVLTKESAYFVCLPAALWLLRQDGIAVLAMLRQGPRKGRWLPTLLRLWPVVLPIAVLALWQLAQRFLVGAVMPSIYAGYVGPGNLPAALMHNFVTGGRVFLLLCAVAPVLAAWRSRSEPASGQPSVGPGDAQAAVLYTALAFALLPLLFPTPLPRYQLPSLPLLCALSALGLARLPAWQRTAGATVVLSLLLLGMQGLWFRRDNAHLEVSMAYRTQIPVYHQALNWLVAAQPRGVIAGFPMSSMLTAPREDGFLSSPLPLVGPASDMAALCRADYLVDAQDDTIGPALAALGRCGGIELAVQLGDATPVLVAGTWRPLDAERDRAVRIYRVRCPASCR